MVVVDGVCVSWGVVSGLIWVACVAFSGAVKALLTEVYVNPTNLGFCLNSASECPDKYHRSVINSFVKRTSLTVPPGLQPTQNSKESATSSQIAGTPGVKLTKSYAATHG